MVPEATAPDRVAMRIATLLSAEIIGAVDREDFGVVIEDIVPVNYTILLDLLALSPSMRKHALRLALIGQTQAVSVACEKYPWIDSFVSSDEESAVAWRNQQQRTIVVVTEQPLAKAASLREFKTIGERNLCQRLCTEERDKAQVSWLRSLWDGLSQAKKVRLSLAQLVAYAARLEDLDEGERSARAFEYLFLLQLFPDEHLADGSSDQRLVRRLQQNRELVDAVLRASEEDWSRVRSYVKYLSGSEKTSASRLLRRLRAVNDRSGQLDDLDFWAVQTLWRAKLPSANGSRSSGGARAEKVPVERVVGRMLMAGDDDGLADIASEIRQIVSATFEDDSTSGEHDVRRGSDPVNTAVVETDRPLLELVRSRSTADEWGGLIEVASEKPSALTEVSAFKSWTGFKFQCILDDVAKFVEGDVVAKGFLAQLQAFAGIRSRLLNSACELTTSPVAALAGDKGLLEAAEEYLAAYEATLRQLASFYPEMLAAADYEAEQIVGKLLTLELYVYRRDGGVEALMSPLHPLYLWRSVMIVRDVRNLLGALSPRERETLEDACATDLQFLQVLVLPGAFAGEATPLMLGQAGSVGRLPLYREAPRGLLELDGIRGITELAQRLARMRPFVRAGIQLMLINAPHPERFIAEFLDALDLDDRETTNSYWGLHIRVRYTDADTLGWANEINDLEESVREQLTAGEERGLVSLSVHPEVVEWSVIQGELDERPAHLTVVVDPFHVKTTPVSRGQGQGLTPWMPTCEYRYNKIRREIQVIPVAEEHVFGSYLAAAAFVNPALQRKTPAHLPQVRDVKDALDAVSNGSMWTIVADPHRVPIARLGTAEVIDRRVERSRQLTSFAHDLSPFVRRLELQLRRTHFLADRETLQRLVRDLVAMEPNGILSLATTGQETYVKGTIGKLIAARWYRAQQPSGLAVSLDTDSARRWLAAGHRTGEKADLLGLREDNGTVIIDVIEVKAHDDVPYTVSAGGISGHPVDQVLATLQALAEVFAAADSSPLARPRREVLRDHLYTALLRDQDQAYIERWHSLLDDMFSGVVDVRLAGRIIHVQLASVAHGSAEAYTASCGISIRVDTLSAKHVGFVLTSSRPTPVQAGLLESEGSPLSTDRGEMPAHVLSLLAGGLGNGALATSSPSHDEASDIVVLDGDLAIDASHGEPAVLEGGDLLDLGRTGDPVLPRDTKGQIDVLLGTEYASSIEVHWQPGRQSNGFFLILGASGSGKTETLKVLGSSIASSGIPLLVFDFHGDVLFAGLRSILLSSGSSSTIGLNPMELDIHSAEESGLYDQRATLRGMISRAVPALGHRQSAILREAFDRAYSDAGIVDSEPTTWTRTPPTFDTVQQILLDWTEADERRAQRAAIEGCLAAVQELFDHPIFSRSSQVSIDEILSSAMRLDLSKLPDHARFVATETLLRRLFRVLKLRGPISVQPANDFARFRLFILIDEAKILSLGTGDRDRSDRILNELITEARKFGIGMILASQMSDHFSEEVRANAATWLVLKPMDIREAKRNAPNVLVEADDLIHLRGRGDGYFRDRPGTRARRIQVRALSE